MINYSFEIEKGDPRMQKQMQILLEQIQYPEHQLFLFEEKMIEKVDVFRQRQEF